MIRFRLGLPRFVFTGLVLVSLASSLRAQETRLSSLSTRAQVGTDANQLFTGFAIGPGAKARLGGRS